MREYFHSLSIPIVIITKTQLAQNVNKSLRNVNAQCRNVNQRYRNKLGTCKIRTALSNMAI